MRSSTIQIRGARQNNLKHLDVDIPLKRITVVSGVSGSGKSSFALDTLYAEGQRRYVETFSPYARQFMDRMDRPQVDRIEGIPPAIAIDRKEPVRTSRSTVGTMTEVTDYVKLLFARLGQLYCRQCEQPVRPDTPEGVWSALAAETENSPVLISFPFSTEGLSDTEVRHQLGGLGFDRLVAEGRVVDLADWKPAAGDTVLNVLADRLKLTGRQRSRVIDSVEQAFRFGSGRLDVWLAYDRRLAFSQELACATCAIRYSAPTPNLFSFNSPVGACSTCRGFGRIIDVDLDLVIPDPSLSIEQGVIKPWGGAAESRMEYEELMAFCRRRRIPTTVPFEKLSDARRRAIIEGTDNYYGVRGFFRWLETRTYKMPVRVFLSRYRSYEVCPDCRGSRFTQTALQYRLGGLTIAQVYAMNVDAAREFFETLDRQVTDAAGRLVMGEVLQRLRYLQDTGLGYLTLDRQSRTLSGGEVQRVALASSLGASLVNTLYILDEPSIGLHPRDIDRLVRILKRLRDQGNTLVVVEHDPDVIRNSDYLLDLGPRAGEHGGEIMYFGPTATVDGSLTGEYLRGRRQIEPPLARRRPRRGRWLTIEGAAENNLKHIDVRIPLGLFVCLTGVSGSGKSTLAEDILFRAVKRGKNDPQGKPGRHHAVRGLSHIDDVVLVDQRPVGRTPRANALTYTKALDPIRRLLADTPLARCRKLGPGHFSFNVAGGRCETCRGDGYEKVEMQFLSDVCVSCPDCQGRRFKPEILEITWRGRSIYDILNLTVDEALAFFGEHRGICSRLSTLAEVGLGYLRLGQPLNTLSGGEAQRLKLSAYLNAGHAARTLFIFDEPTTGLHLEDIGILLAALQRLVDAGHTVLVIEHNLDVINTADWIIDLGPEGGDAGGQVVAAGPVSAIVAEPASHTGRFLTAHLARKTEFAGSDHFSPSVSETVSGSDDVISVSGAREHNLRNLDLSIPHNQLVALTGVSGSGKSTLAFDILFAEGQRRYLESLAPYVRQYMKVLERPDVDLVTGLAPTVAIEQRASHAGRRSTVATLTEIYHFLRLLYSKVGTPHCTGCGRRLVGQSRDAIVRTLGSQFGRKKAAVLAVKVAGRKGYHKDVLSRALKNGFVEGRIDGKMVRLVEGMALSRYHDHTIELVVGHLPAPDPAAVVDTALKEGDGSLVVMESGGGESVFSLRGVCPSCGTGAVSSDPRLFSFNSPHGACPDCEGLGVIDSPGVKAVNGDRLCPSCGGSRLRPEALAVKIDGLSIWDLVRQPAGRVLDALKHMAIPRHQRPVADPILAEIQTRIALLNRLGLSYLSLGRSGDTLSGGEAQRVRLAAQLGSNLTGACYILDEPTIGLHPRDNTVLLDALKSLRDRGNTVLVVEHDEETIRAADTIIDLGPGAGQDGGAVIAIGSLEDIRRSPASVTGRCIEGGLRQTNSFLRPYRNRPALRVSGARANNLKDIDVSIPLGTLIAVTGVSGSGKSSLLKTTVYRGLVHRLSRKALPDDSCRQITGWDALTRVVEVDHSPIGRTPRSVPASYVGFLGDIRRLLAATPEARARGYSAGRFSFNVAAGRCEACKGHGSTKTAMSFLPDVYVHCEVCGGRRFNPETLAVSYRGKTIADILDMTFEEATAFFAAVPKIRKSVEFVCDIGLGYLRLGQPSPTLSGGEAQRIKLAEQLAGASRGHTLYILDEPTTGLHISDVKKLIHVLQALVEAGNSVAVIEHNLELIASADYVIDLGPEGGDSGGEIVFTGSPKELIHHPGTSHTATYLMRYLEVN